MNGDNIGEYDFDVLMLALRDLIAEKGIGNVIEGFSDKKYPSIVTLPLNYVTKIDNDNLDGMIFAEFPLEDGARFNAAFVFDYPYNVKLIEINGRYEGAIKILGIMRPTMLNGVFVVAFGGCRIIS